MLDILPYNVDMWAQARGSLHLHFPDLDALERRVFPWPLLGQTLATFVSKTTRNKFHFQLEKSKINTEVKRNYKVMKRIQFDHLHTGGGALYVACNFDDHILVTAALFLSALNVQYDAACFSESPRPRSLVFHVTPCMGSALETLGHMLDLATHRAQGSSQGGEP